MKPLLFLLPLYALVSASASASPAAFSADPATLTDHALISIQPIPTSHDAPLPAPHPLATLSFNPSTLLSALTDYAQPDLPAATTHLRVGIYDVASATWRSATSMTSVESFARGYRPTLVLSLDAGGAVVGVAVKSSAVDAGQTRDFAPRVLVRRMEGVRRVELNRPVVLKEGKVEVPEVEKTFLQKYWWMILGGVMLLVTAGGGGE